MLKIRSHEPLILSRKINKTAKKKVKKVKITLDIVTVLCVYLYDKEYNNNDVTDNHGGVSIVQQVMI